MFQMQANRAGQNQLLQVATFSDEVLDRIPVADPRHVLFDDGPVVQLLRNIVAGGANQFNTSLMGLVILRSLRTRASSF